MPNTLRAGALTLAALFCVTAASGQALDDTPAPVSAESPVDKAFAAAREVAVGGPAAVPWAGQATLQLPEGYAYVPRPAADQIMDVYGNSYDDRFLGLVFPMSDANWFIVAEYEHSGYIKDDDAKDWDVDELLRSVKDGTEAQNERRREAGIGELVIDGWAEPPAYDAATHRLVWSVAAHDKGGEAGAARTINYNTYMLGREGYITMNLVTGSDTIATDKADAHTLLAALSFDQGRAYADFNEDTDKVAAYGIAALVAGVAAKKLGLFAVVAAFMAKFGKLFILAAAAGGAALWKRLRGKTA